MDQGTERGERRADVGVGMVVFIGGPIDGERRPNPDTNWHIVPVATRPPQITATKEGMNMVPVAIENHTYQRQYMGPFCFYVWDKIGPIDVQRMLLSAYPRKDEVLNAYEIQVDGVLSKTSPLLADGIEGKDEEFMRRRLAEGCADQLMKRDDLIERDSDAQSRFWHLRAIVLSLREYAGLVKRTRY